MKVGIISASGTKTDKFFSLDKELEVKEIKNHQLLKDVYTANLGNIRQNLAQTKTRGDVRGGGKKPWRQKGTGRARFGSTRNPIWKGGGVAFGPTGTENYSSKVNKKARKLALKQALNLALTSNKLSVINKIELKEPKTTQINKLLLKLQLKTPVIIVESKLNPNLILASRNLKDIYVKTYTKLSVNDLIDANSLLFTEESIQKICLNLKSGDKK